MKKGTKIAHLHWSEDGHGISVVRMANPIVDGRFTGHGWYDMPCHTTLSPQKYANKVGEVVFYTDSYDTSGYVYPEEVLKMQDETLTVTCREVVIDLSTFFSPRAKFSELSSYRQKAINLAGNDKEVILTGAAPVWLYLDIAHALHGKVKSLVYRSPVTGDAVIGDYAPEGTAY